MELQINDLVSAIKKDGMEEALKEAELIISRAKNEAETIINDAKNNALKITEDAKKEVAVFEENARVSAEQAKRDAMLAFKSEVQAEFEKILSADVTKTLNDKNLASIILAAVKDEDVSKYSVELQSVSDALKSELAEKIKAGLELKPSKGINAGFKLAAKDGSGYFDCSDEELTNMLMPFFRDIRL